jgi:hypothetical protein
MEKVASLLNFLKFLKASTFWIGLGSVATSIMALLTYRLLRYYGKTDKQRTVRESLERIIQPLIKDLENMIDKLRILSLSRSGLIVSIENVWRWPEIEKANSFLVYWLPRRVKEKVENFHVNLEKFIHLHNQREYLLDELISGEIKAKLLQELRKRTGRDSLGSGSRGTYYQLTVGGKRRHISFYELIFKDQTLAEYIDELKKDPTIPNADIEDEKFIVDEAGIEGLCREDFEEMASTILRKIERDFKLREFVEECRKICKEAQALEQDLQYFLKEANN